MKSSLSNLSFNVFFLQNPKSFFITSVKVGSRYVSDNLKVPHLNYEFNSYKDLSEFNPKYINLNYDSGYNIDTNEYLSDIKKDWIEILNKKSNKEIVILFRNPFKRLVSAIVEDVNLFFDNNVYVITSNLLINLGYSKKDTEILFKFRNKGILDNKSDYEKMINMLKIIYQIFINDNILNQTANAYHSGTLFSSYMFPLSYIVTNNIFDINKIKLIDLDNSTNSLDNYFILNGIFTKENTYSNTNKGMYIVESILKELCESSNKLEYLLKNEFIGYNILKTYEETLNK